MAPFLLAPSIAAASDPQTVAALVAQGRFAEAYQVATQIRDEHEGEPGFDFSYGIAAIDSGHVNEGIFALERVLLVQPENDRARAELARGYFILEEDDRARNEFNIVLGRNPPAAVRTNIDRFMDAIRAREGKYRTTKSAYAELGFGYDTNINSGPDDNIVPIGGFNFTLPDEAVETDAPFIYIEAGGNIEHPIAPGVAVYGALSANQRYNNEHSLDIGNLTGRGGFKFKKDKNQWIVGLQGNKYYVRGDINRNLIGLQGEWRRRLSARTTLMVFGQFADLGYPEQKLRNSQLKALGVGGTHVFSGRLQPVLFVGVFGGREDADNAAGKHLAERDIAAGQLGLQLSLNPTVSLQGSLSVQTNEYGAPYILFGKTRDDRIIGGNIAAVWRPDKRMSFSVGVGHTDNRSNIGIFDTDRTLVEFSARYEFL